MKWPWLELNTVHWPSAPYRAQAGMRLDISLVHRLGGVATFDDHLGLIEAVLDVALVEVHPLGDVRWLGRFRIHPGGEQVVVQDRRIVLHRVLDVDDVGQHLVLHVDQLERFVADRLRNGAHRGDRVPLVQRLVARHAVARKVAEVHRPLADERLFRRDVGQVGGCDHRTHTRQLQRLRRIDRHDARMRVRRALHLAPQHAGHHHIRAELGTAGDLVHAIRPDRARADNSQICAYIVHRAAPRISAAASITARMILS